MTLVILAAAWIGAVACLGVYLFKGLPKFQWRAPIAIVVPIMLLPLPLLDELLGQAQFKKLCEQETNEFHAQAKAAVGRRVYLTSEPQHFLPSTWIRVRAQPWHVVDARSEKTLLTYNVLYAEGGRFVPAADSGHEPLTFRGVCGPTSAGADHASLIRRLGAVWVERPIEVTPTAAR